VFVKLSITAEVQHYVIGVLVEVEELTELIHLDGAMRIKGEWVTEIIGSSV
jgi:hypothetical protein